jgi:hypothetical protein
MTAKLHFQLTHKAHPFADEESAKGEAWGELTIYILDLEETLLFKTEWNLDQLIEWYINGDRDRFSTTLQDVHSWESLSQALIRLSSQIDEDDDEEIERWHEVQYNFRLSHSIRFALRGISVPDIIIGVNKKEGEISLAASISSGSDEASQTWCRPPEWGYSFDIDEFRIYMKTHLKQFLDEWIHDSREDVTVQRAMDLIKALES